MSWRIQPRSFRIQHTCLYTASGTFSSTLASSLQFAALKGYIMESVNQFADASWNWKTFFAFFRSRQVDTPWVTKAVEKIVSAVCDLNLIKIEKWSSNIHDNNWISRKRTACEFTNYLNFLKLRLESTKAPTWGITWKISRLQSELKHFGTWIIS